MHRSLPRPAKAYVLGWLYLPDSQAIGQAFGLFVEHIRFAFCSEVDKIKEWGAEGAPGQRAATGGERNLPFQERPTPRPPIMQQFL